MLCDKQRYSFKYWFSKVSRMLSILRRKPLEGHCRKERISCNFKDERVQLRVCVTASGKACPDEGNNLLPLTLEPQPGLSFTDLIFQRLGLLTSLRILQISADPINCWWPGGSTYGAATPSASPHRPVLWRPSALSWTPTTHSHHTTGGWLPFPPASNFGQPLTLPNKWRPLV